MKPTRLPAPAMPLLTPHDEYSMAHLIERHIDFVETDKDGNERSVALDPTFVRHYMKYRASKLPLSPHSSPRRWCYQTAPCWQRRGLTVSGALFPAAT